jgi:hypothetical protein
MRIHGLVWAWAFLSLISVGQILLAHDLEDIEDDEAEAWAEAIRHVNSTVGKPPAGSLMVDEITLPGSAASELPDEAKASALKLYREMDSDVFDERERATEGLKELGLKNPGLYSQLKTLKRIDFSLEVWWRIGRVTSQLAPSMSWEQARLKMFLHAKKSAETAAIAEIAKNLFSNFSSDDRATLAANALKRKETMAENKGYNPYTGKNSKQHETLVALMNSDFALFKKAAEASKYEFVIDKEVGLTQITRFATIHTSDRTLRLELRQNENIRLLGSMQTPPTPIRLVPGEWMAADMRLPNNVSVGELGEIALYPKILLGEDGKMLFSLQQYNSFTGFSPDPLAAPTAFLISRFPANRADIEKVHLTETARIKAGKLGE